MLNTTKLNLVDAAYTLLAEGEAPGIRALADTAGIDPAHAWRTIRSMLQDGDILVVTPRTKTIWPLDLYHLIRHAANLRNSLAGTLQHTLYIRLRCNNQDVNFPAATPPCSAYDATIHAIRTTMSQIEQNQNDLFRQDGRR